MKKFFLILLALPIAACASISNVVKRSPGTLLTSKSFGKSNLSPDGRTIVFALQDWGKSSQLFKVSAVGSNMVPLASGETYDCEPAFSPDGSKIAYFRGSEGNGDINIMNADGSGRMAVTSGPDNDFEPVWSADGERIYFLRSPVFTNYSPLAAPAWHNVDIYSIKPDGTDLRRITKEAYYRLSDLSVNPASNSLMTYFRNGRETGIQIIPIENPSNKRIVRPDLQKYRRKKFFWREKVDYSLVREPQFSPDGKHMLFTYLDDLFVMDLADNRAEMVWKWHSKDLRSRALMYPRYSFDGERIVFTAIRGAKSRGIWGNDPWPLAKNEPELWIINSDGKKSQEAMTPVFNSEKLITNQRPF